MGVYAAPHDSNQEKGHNARREDLHRTPGVAFVPNVHPYKSREMTEHKKIFFKTAGVIRMVLGMSSNQTILYNDDIEDAFGADSLDKVEIIMKLEKIYNITIDKTDEGVDGIKTVGDLVETIENLLKTK